MIIVAFMKAIIYIFTILHKDSEIQTKKLHMI